MSLKSIDDVLPPHLASGLPKGHWAGIGESKMTMPFEIITVNSSNVDVCEYCGANPVGHARKRKWIRQGLPHGLRYKTIRESATGKTAGMIEYMPARSAWRAVQAEGHLVIHCVQVPKRYAGQGLGSLLSRNASAMHKDTTWMAWWH